LRQLLGLRDRFIDATDHVESGFGQVIIIAVHYRLEGADRVFELHELTRDAGEDFSDVERLRQEALNLPRAADRQFVLFG